MRNMLHKTEKKTFLGKVFTQKRLSQKLKTIFLKKFYASNQTSWGSHVERGWVSCVNSRHRPLQLTSRMLSRAVSSVLAIKANPRHRLSNLSILLFFFLACLLKLFSPHHHLSVQPLKSFSSFTKTSNELDGFFVWKFNLLLRLRKDNF